MVSVDPNILEALAAKTLPHNREAEEAVLGSLLQDGDAVAEVVEFLNSDDFFVRTHQVVFDAMVELFKRGSGIDLTIVGEELQKRGEFDRIGGALEIARLVERVPSAANVKYHAKIVHERSLQRRLIRAAGTILEEVRAGGKSIEEMVDTAEAAVFEVAGRSVGSEAVSIGATLQDALRELEIRRSGGVLGVRTNYQDLDDKLCGLQAGQLLILAARPSVGKTSFALNVALRAATQNHPPTHVALFSLEMPRNQLAQNMLACHGRIDAHKLRRGLLDGADFERIPAIGQELSQAPIFIDDGPGLTALQIRAKARRLKAQKEIGLVIVDYLQLVASPRAETREQEIAQISMTLKHLARELEVPVLAVAQLNRAVDNRDSPRPRLSDLRESGSIEQDADVVMFLHRDEGHEALKNPHEQMKITLTIAKNRNGPVGELPLVFFPFHVRFESAAVQDWTG